MSEIKVNKISPKQTCTTVTLGDSGDDFVVATGANLKTAAVKDTAGNVIVSRCGSNITIGSSGAAIALACGATQTGFGRTGTVNWDTTAKTASFTAVSGNGYFVNTTSGAITVTLPATPSAGDIVAVKDYANTADTNAITIARNGSNIDGTAEDPTIANEGGSITLVYVDATKGWLVTDAAQKSDISFPTYIVATGGTVTCCGDYKIHTFTGPGTFTVCSVGTAVNGNKVDYLVVAGGGAGGGVGGTGAGGTGGGGAGGTRFSDGTISGCYSAGPAPLGATALTVTATAFPITVGGGAAASPNTGASGSPSTFSTITSAGGGGGGGWSAPTCYNATNGGSGGGGTYTGNAGTGNTPPSAPPQGNNGGTGENVCAQGGGGGGGATAAGTNGGPNSGGPGGNGVTNAIKAACQSYGGGGGGSVGDYPAIPGRTVGTGGIGGGGDGVSVTGPGQPGTANTGGGGGGAENITSGQPARTGGAGGSGIVIIRYKFQ